ncbi:MAG: ribosomal protein S18-alanine N-acetyltransferase [Deltaproteobacteria bacterium]|nr:ribosomal protein S18-alanine N-acetyltransferase [Deltaproteobacteria bacterium]
MSPLDINEVLKIEDESFPKPWAASLFEKELKNPFSLSFVARLNKKDSSKLIGYIVIWLVAEEAHILNIAVHPDYRRKGIGKRLIKFIMDFLLNKSTRAVYLEVRDSNTAAQKLYRGFGFREIGIRKGYYSDNKEDAVVMGFEMNITQNLKLKSQK